MAARNPEYEPLEIAGAVVGAAGIALIAMTGSFWAGTLILALGLITWKLGSLESELRELRGDVKALKSSTGDESG
ncbi:hypothetical protein A3L11_10355 [Thermococcus siculi]|uniref:Uncharacterized protein n=1 Tax=Thermococcus siculi TaxID=72803 RepID=A0A2Z2MQH1_9EURY|nr:hypothetical protein A3L11_10355 [Thermococcus siculi]